MQVNGPEVKKLARKKSMTVGVTFNMLTPDSIQHTHSNKKSGLYGRVSTHTFTTRSLSLSVSDQNSSSVTLLLFHLSGAPQMQK